MTNSQMKKTMTEMAQVCYIHQFVKGKKIFPQKKIPSEDHSTSDFYQALKERIIAIILKSIAQSREGTF